MVKYSWLTLIPLALISVGCNAFAPLDSPSGDVSVLAAARACFDLGDFQCAVDKYHTLELSTSDATLNQAYSEDAFAILAQKGITFGIFMGAVIESGGKAGALINLIAGVLRTNAATNPLSTSPYAIRTTLFGAYQKSLRITNAKSRGLIKFITALTFMSEILGEDAKGINTTKKVGILQQADLVLNPTTCLATGGVVGPALLSECTVPVGSTIIDGAVAINLTTATAADLSGAPSLQMILAASTEIQAGITLLSSSGGIGSDSGSLATSLLGQAIGTPSGSPGLRYTLVSLGIGEK